MERTVTIWVTDQEGHRLKRQQPEKLRYVNTDVLEGTDHPGDIEGCIVNIYDTVTYQTFGGIGGRIFLL